MDGWQVVAVEVHSAAWCVVAFDRVLADPVNVQLGVPVIVDVLFEPASVIVTVNGAVVRTATVEFPNGIEPIELPVRVSFPTL